MADHNTLIGSTAREIEGGTVLIGGVLREIESGLVLVNGVSREIEFGGGKKVITITGTGNTTRCHVTIGGTKYTSGATVEVDTGTVITLYINGSPSFSAIYINGSQVGTETATYSYAVEKNVEIKLEYRMTTSGSARRYYAYIYVTEQ